FSRAMRSVELLDINLQNKTIKCPWNDTK
ncbi:uncharacterized protein METZ01_LOCUS453707, partial [marine metagenome]